MADLLTTSTINSLVSNYKLSETNKSVTPLTARKTKYSSVSSAYDTLLTKLNALKTELTALNKTDADSIFSYKAASSSNTSYVGASAGAGSLAGSYEIFVSQLAKKDLAVSRNFTSSDSVTLTGKHTFTIITGDGEGGEFNSNIEVEFSGSETNKTAMEKIQAAINTDKAVVQSGYKTGTDAYTGGASTFVIDINGTETTITLDGTAATYSELLDQVVEQIGDNIEGVTAVKEEDPGTPGSYRLSLSVNDASKYISISSDTGFDLVSDLGISVTKEKGASGIVTASSFSPVQGSSQLNITAKESGLDYRIKDLSDTGTSSALNSFGLNLGTSRPAFDQGTNTAGFSYSDITTANNLLNAKFTFNGLDIQRSSNTITDLAEGLTLNLKSTMDSGENAVTVAVSNDNAAVKAKIESFITKFNDIYTYIKNNSTYTSGTRGSLYGDSSGQAITGYFSSMAYSTVAGLDVSSFAAIGISFNSTSGLSLSNTTLFEEKMNQSSEDVAALFNSENGLTTKLLSFIDPYLGSAGYLKMQKSTLDSNIKSVSDRIKSAETRIEKSAEMLRRRYEQLQIQLATLMSSQSFFSSDLSGLL